MSQELPLLSWQTQVEIDRLAARRAELCQRIANLKPHCHQRIALGERLRQLTIRQIELENQLRKGPR